MSSPAYTQEEQRARGDYRTLNRLAQGMQSTHWFRGMCYPDNTLDLAWAESLVWTYIRNLEIGQPCLLRNFASEETIRSLHQQLRERYKQEALHEA